MTIVAECPHCESRYNLQPDMVGKTMRCPNLSCRGVFTVAAISPPGPPPPAPKPIADNRASPAAAVVEAKLVSPPPKEVVWSAEENGYATPARPRMTASEVIDDAEDDEVLIRRRRKKRWPKVLLFGSLAATVGLGIFIAVYIVRMNLLAESQLVKKAEEELKAGQYGVASKTFEQLAAEYPESPDRDKYRFCADLAMLRGAVQSVANRESPGPSLQKWAAFLKDHRDSPFAKPISGYGRDLLDAGMKLAEDVADHAQGQVKKYQAGRTTPEDLGKAEAEAAEGRKLLPTLEPFRDPEAPTLDKLSARFDQIERDVRDERERSAFLADIRNMLAEPADETIDRAEQMVKGRGLDSAPDFRQAIDSAKARLRGLIRFVPNPSLPLPAPPVTGSYLLFAPPVGRLDPAFSRIGPGDAPPGVFLAAARGILYALDERTGALLWAERIGLETFAPPARYSLDDGSSDIVLVTSDAGSGPALTARRIKTGQPLWHQPLPAPAVGPAVVLGRRAYVAVRDPHGSVVEFDLISGSRLGSIALGQPIGVGAVLRPGTGLIYVAAEARRVFVLDVGSFNDEGGRLDPRCVQVIATGHPPGTLRAPPTFIGPDGLGPDPRGLVLCQANGPRESKLRAFKLIDPPPASGPNVEPLEMTLPVEAEFTISGWPWFPFPCDGERLAVATDDGQFRLFGVNQPGNQDRALFPIAPTPPPAEQETNPLPSLVVPGPDNIYWVLAGGLFGKFRLSLDPAQGQVLIPVGEKTNLGVPTQPSHTDGPQKTAYVVVRSIHSAGYRAVAFDLADGTVRWVRQLGLVPSAPPVSLGENVLFADEDGGLTLVPSAALAGAASGDRVADPEWRIAPPLVDPAGPTALTASSDGHFAWSVTPHGPDSAQTFAIRCISEGRVVSEKSLAAPGRLAGAPLASGDALLIPASDGYIYRFTAETARLAAGPVWRAERVGAEAICHLAAIDDNEFLATDGQRGVLRCSWPKDGSDWRRVGERLNLPDRIALAPLVLPASSSNDRSVLVADQLGGAWHYSLNRWEVLHRWRSGGSSPIPVGPASAGFVVDSGSEGRPAVAYVVASRAIVVLNPAVKAPTWVAAVPQGQQGMEFVGPPRPTLNGDWVAADLGGKCMLFEGATGKVKDVVACAKGEVPGSALSLVGPRSALIPLSNGSAALLSWPNVEEAPMPRAILER